MVSPFSNDYLILAVPADSGPELLGTDQCVLGTELTSLVYLVSVAPRFLARQGRVQPYSGEQERYSHIYDNPQLKTEPPNNFLTEDYF
jgi:hypothetical protein